MQILQDRESRRRPEPGHDGDEQQVIDHEIDAQREALLRRLGAEEWLNAATHALGLVLSLIGSQLLLSRTLRFGTDWEFAGCAIYAAALVAVYAASTLSHLFQHPRLRRLFRILDQAVIFLLIAGTYTPLAMAYLRHGAWWWLFAAMWGIGLFGFFSKALFAHRVDAVTTGLHVAMGWLPVAALKPMIGLLPGGLLWWMFYGGVCYTLGTFVLQRDDRVPYFHALWHVLVIAGSACHFWGIYQYCTGTIA